MPPPFTATCLAVAMLSHVTLAKRLLKNAKKTPVQADIIYGV
jgi:hypothetical protein